MITRGVAELVALAAAAITTIWVSRVMGAEFLGLYAVAATILAFAQTVADAGLPSLGAQLIANDPASERAIWRNVTRVRSVGAAAGAILGALLLVLIDPASPLSTLLVGTLVALAITPLNSTFVLVAVGAIRSVALVRALGALSSALIAVLFIRSEADIVVLAFLLAVPGIVNAVGSTALILRHVPHRRLHEDLGSMPATLGAWYRRGFDYAKADVSILIYMSADRLILFVTAGVTVVGLYEAASRLISPFYALSTVIRESMFLELARAVRGDRLALTMRRWSRSMFVATIPLGPFLTLHGAWVIALVYGAGFAGATPSLMILGWAITIGFISGAVVLPFLSWNLGREYGNAVLAGNVTNLGANVVLTPALGATGAALATVAAKVAVTAFGLGPFRSISAFPIVSYSMRFLAASILAAVASGAAWVASGQELASIVAFAVAYAGSVLVLEWAEARAPGTLRAEP
jgi:O-antigen/teichoic acid export membrane protein